jgi:hypothetical protein
MVAVEVILGSITAALCAICTGCCVRNWNEDNRRQQGQSSGLYFTSSDYNYNNGLVSVQDLDFLRAQHVAQLNQVDSMIARERQLAYENFMASHEHIRIPLRARFSSYYQSRTPLYIRRRYYS